MHSKVADFAATVASHFLSGSPSTMGSLYSRAFDELGTGCQRIFPGLRCSFVAESDPTKLRVLWESFGPDRCYTDVSEVDGCYPADVVVASPPCLVFSKANRTSTAEGQLATAREHKCPRFAARSASSRLGPSQDSFCRSGPRRRRRRAEMLVSGDVRYDCERHGTLIENRSTTRHAQ